MKEKDGGLRKIFRQHLGHFHWQSVESLYTGNGTPDSNYCWGGYEGWVEFKKTEANAIKFQTEQPGWHIRRARAGGRTFVAVRVLKKESARKRATDALALYRGSDIEELRDYGLAGAPPLALEEGGPAAWNWARIGTILTSGPDQASRRAFGALRAAS